MLPSTASLPRGGPLSSGIVTVWSLPSRNSTVTGLPSREARREAMPRVDINSSSVDLPRASSILRIAGSTSLPAIFWTCQPGLMPCLSAGEPGSTETTIAWPSRIRRSRPGLAPGAGPLESNSLYASPATIPKWVCLSLDSMSDRMRRPSSRDAAASILGRNSSCTACQSTPLVLGSQCLSRTVVQTLSNESIFNWRWAGVRPVWPDTATVIARARVAKRSCILQL